MEENFNKKPNFFNHQFHYGLDGFYVNIYLDVDNKDKLLGLYFETDNEKILSSFNKYSRLSKGKGLKDLTDNLVPDQGIDQIVFLLSLISFSQYLGKDLNIKESKGKNVCDTLVCFCFGVFKSDIDEVISNEDISFERLKIKTKASLGCGRCKEDLSTAFYQNESIGSRSLFQKIGKTPVQLVLEIDEFLRLKKYDLEIENFKGRKIYFKNFDEAKFPDLRDELLKEFNILISS